MKSKVSKLGIPGLLVLALITAGCLVSGTFVVVENVTFSFTADSGFYWFPVDLASNADWEERQADIDDLDAIGFSFVIENTSDVASTFSVQFAAAIEPLVLPISSMTQPTVVPSGAVTVISGLSVPANSSRTVTYAESLGMISNFAALKAIILTGRFDYFGASSGGSGDFPFVVTEGKIIITVSASTT